MNTIVPLTRREILQRTGAGFGWLALSALLADQMQAAPFNSPLAPRSPHFTPKAKRVIFLFMQGAPSHVDTFDWKPELKAKSGKTFAVPGDEKARPGTLLAPQFEFTPRGKSGLPISSLFPEIAKHADELCLLNGMHTSNAAHPQASIALHTGSVNFVRPSLGSWVVYGLGSESQQLPGFVSINPTQNVGGAQNYGSSFLPASFQGTRVDLDQGGIPDIRNKHLSPSRQRAQIDLIQEMNRDLLAGNPGHRELDGVIQSFEMAYQMQSSVPEVFDLSGESEATRERYGIGQSETNSFGTQCLAARRLAESGVRFIQISKGGWDQHQNLKSDLTKNCRATDKPIAALLQDLKERSMLDDTLVVWGGEFGRSPQDQGKDGDGRRHNNRGYTMWMAGGGVKGGLRYGATDEVGDTAVEGKIGTHDLHATILHLLGIDHTKLTYRYSGRDFRLTDVYGEVVREIMA